MLEHSAELRLLARRYVWWDSPERAIERLDVLLCQLMQLGRAPPGVLDAKSWNYWHRFFGIPAVPPLPERPLP